MDRMVYYRGKQYEDVGSLQNAVEEAWVTCTGVHNANLYRRIPRRLLAVIDGAGGQQGIELYTFIYRFSLYIYC